MTRKAAKAAYRCRYRALTAIVQPDTDTSSPHLSATIAETGEHPLLHLQIAASGRDLRTAGDMAAVYWRLPELAAAGPGPLPWLSGIPEKLQERPACGERDDKRPSAGAERGADRGVHEQSEQHRGETVTWV
jgi:hypothetical protein